MCKAVYLASTRELPVIPWDDAVPAFYAVPAEADEPIRSRLGRPHIVYLGSHEGCGCGFSHDDDDDDLALRLGSLARMAEYIGEASASGEVLVWVGWEGKELRPPCEELEIRTSEAQCAETWTPLLRASLERPTLVRVRARSQPDDPRDEGRSSGDTHPEAVRAAAGTS